MPSLEFLPLYPLIRPRVSMHMDAPFPEEVVFPRILESRSSHLWFGDKCYRHSLFTPQVATFATTQQRHIHIN